MTDAITLFPGVGAGAETVYEAAVAACRSEMDAAGLSNARAAREIGTGVSEATLSKWLRGVYEGDVAAVTARVAAWLETRREARARDLAPAGLDRHAALGVTEEIEAALTHAQASGDVVLVHGPSGRGKSWAAGHYCRTRSGASCLAVTGATVSLAGLLGRVADAVGAGSRHGSALEAETAVVARLKDRGALLVIDEAHHLGGRQIDELRCIRDLAGCGLALVGDDTIRMTLARCPQVSGRIGVRVGLGAASETDIADLAAGVLGRKPATGELKRLLAAARGPGGLHALRRHLARAWTIARAEGRERIEAADIAAAEEAA